MADTVLIKSKAGVRLERIESLAKRQKTALWRVTTKRPAMPRQFHDQSDAEMAFDIEVIASLSDPVIIEMQRRGLID
ncbi:MAG: hypothetical protein LCH57_02030 [Proteobacteria bacterium]|nr:hypothetical protein [Pseudomonadota bacterium]